MPEPHAKGPVAMKTTSLTYIGMDVHKETIAVSARQLAGAEPEFWQRAATPVAITRLAKEVKAKYGTAVRACYEAGPTGFGLQRAFEAEGLICEVIAPSLIPRKPGERRKTDRLDAHRLSEYLSHGALTPIHVPTPEEEAARDLVRAARTAREDCADTRRRLRSFLLRMNIRRAEGDTWTKEFVTWLRGLKLAEPSHQTTLVMMLREFDMRREQVEAWDRHLEQLAQTPAFESKVRALTCLKGVARYGALVLATEVLSPERFRSAGQLMSYVGLVVAEDSTGTRQRRLSITKTGNTHARHMLVEAAHASRFKSLNRGKEIKQRRAGQPAWAVDLAMKAERRLHDRYMHLTRAGKPDSVVITAIARELAGFVWAMLQAEAQARRPATVDADGVVTQG